MVHIPSRLLKAEYCCSLLSEEQVDFSSVPWKLLCAPQVINSFVNICIRWGRVLSETVGCAFPVTLIASNLVISQWPLHPIRVHRRDCVQPSQACWVSAVILQFCRASLPCSASLACFFALSSRLKTWRTVLVYKLCNSHIMKVSSGWSFFMLQQ